MHLLNAGIFFLGRVLQFELIRDSIAALTVNNNNNKISIRARKMVITKSE